MFFRKPTANFRDIGLPQRDMPVKRKSSADHRDVALQRDPFPYHIDRQSPLMKFSVVLLMVSSFF